MSAPPLQRITVEKAVDAYLRGVARAVAGHTLSASTARNYERDLAEFVELAGPDTILDDLTGGDVDDIVLAYASRPDGRYRDRPPVDPATGKPRTRGAGATARFRQSISRLFSEAALEGWVEASPMPRTRVRPKMKGLTNVARRALSEESAAALLDAAAELAAAGPARRDQQLALRDRFLLGLLMEAGPRVSEVCAADQADVEHRTDGTTWLRLHGKGGKERWVPLGDGTWAAYEAYRDTERPAPQPRLRRDPETGDRVQVAGVDDAERALLLTWRGLRMRPRDVQYVVERACARLPGTLRRRVTPHGLRHTAATLLLASGAADVRTVKELLGHASIATTGVYLDTEAHEVAAAVAAHPVTGTRRT